MKVTSLDEFEEAREALQAGEVDEVEVELKVKLNGESLKRMANVVRVLGDDVEVEGSCVVQGVLTREESEERSLEQRVKELAERVDSLSKDLSSY